MPYVLEKGPLLQKMELAYTAADASTRRNLLHHLYTSNLVVRDDGGASDYPDIIGTALGPATRHANMDWFGLEPVGGFGGNSSTVQQANQTDGLGYWMGWWGDAHGIFRSTLIRAVEASLGYAHNEAGYATPLPDTASAGQKKTWPQERRLSAFEFLWVCGAPKFEGWVRWREVGDAGLVIVVFTTPGNILDPLCMKLTHPASGYSPRDSATISLLDVNSALASPSATKAASEGLIVVGHDVAHEVMVRPASTPALPGEWSFDPPKRVWSDPTSPVVAVSPALVDGGV
jgi:hypothetical protein